MKKSTLCLLEAPGMVGVRDEHLPSISLCTWLKREVEVRSRQTLCVVRMAQMAVWYWGMDSESGIPGSPAPTHQIGSQLPTTKSTLTGDYRWGINLKNKRSFEGLRNIIEVKLPDCCPKWCGSISQRGGSWCYCGRCYWALESRISTLCNLFCYIWVRNQIFTSESWGLCCHPCQQKQKLHAFPTFSCYPFLNQISGVCVCVCVCVCVGGPSGSQSPDHMVNPSYKGFGNLNSDFILGKKGLFVCRYPQIWKKLLKVDGNCESDRCPQ